MFLRTPNGQKQVDMFLTAIMRTGKENEYLNGSLVPCGDGGATFQGRYQQRQFGEEKRCEGR